MVTLEPLRVLSARIGSDPLLIQAAGGNTSIKSCGIMWIKASGTWLRDATARDIFVAIDHDALREALERNDPACETCTEFVAGGKGKSGLRPSIETSVHALMPQSVVLHVHCVNTIALAIRANGEQELVRRLARFRWRYIPYARPGLPLAREICRRLAPDTEVLVLENHGLVVAAETVEAAGALLARVTAALSLVPRPALPPDRKRLEAFCAANGYRPAEHDDTHALATDLHALRRSRNAAYYPDHVVFLGTGVATDFADHAPLVAIEGVGVAIGDGAAPAVEPMGRCLADVMRRISAEDRLRALGMADIDQLLNWDAEIYRQSLPRP